MILKVILLYFGFLQIQLPCSYDIKFKELNELAIELEMHHPKERPISYNRFIKGFYESITLPSLKEAFLYDTGEGDYVNSTFWLQVHARNCSGWIEWLTAQRNVSRLWGNMEKAQEIHLIIRDVEWVYGIYDAADDLSRGSYPPLKRRKAIKYVKDRIGEEAFFKMELPRPEEFIWAHWRK